MKAKQYSADVRAGSTRSVGLTAFVLIAMGAGLWQYGQQRPVPSPEPSSGPALFMPLDQARKAAKSCNTKDDIERILGEPSRTQEYVLEGRRTLYWFYNCPDGGVRVSFDQHNAVQQVATITFTDSDRAKGRPPKIDTSPPDGVGNGT